MHSIRIWILKSNSFVLFIFVFSLTPPCSQGGVRCHEKRKRKKRKKWRERKLKIYWYILTEKQWIILSEWAVNYSDQESSELLWLNEQSITLAEILLLKDWCVDWWHLSQNTDDICFDLTSHDISNRHWKSLLFSSSFLSQ